MCIIIFSLQINVVILPLNCIVLVLYLYIHFFALIHPIQWTIANPVSAAWPAKISEKDGLCFHRPAGPSTVHLPGGASYFLPV